MERSTESQFGTVHQTADTLTTIPAAVTTSGTRVAATLFAPDAVAWDLSTVTFSPPGFFSRFRPWFIPSAILTTLFAVGLLLKFGLGAELNSRIRMLRRSKQKAIASIERDLEEATAIFSHSREHFADSELEADWNLMTDAITRRLRELGRRSEPWHSESFRLIDRVLNELKQPNKAITTFAPPSAEELTTRLNLIHDELESLDSKGEYLARTYQRRQEITAALWIVTAAALICVIFLLAFLARAQTASQSPQLRPALAMLCDLDITLTPRDTQTMTFEKVDVLLKFSPLSADPHQRCSSLQIGSTGRVTIDPVTPPTNPKMSLLKQSGSLITLGFTTTYSPMLKRLGALSHLISQFKIPTGYPKEISTSNQLSFTYTLDRAEILHTHVGAGRDWLYLFPFDSAGCLHSDRPSSSRTAITHPASETVERLLCGRIYRRTADISSGE